MPASVRVLEGNRNQAINFHWPKHNHRSNCTSLLNSLCSMRTQKYVWLARLRSEHIYARGSATHLLLVPGLLWSFARACSLPPTCQATSCGPNWIGPFLMGLHKQHLPEQDLCRSRGSAPQVKRSVWTPCVVTAPECWKANHIR